MVVDDPPPHMPVFGIPPPPYNHESLIPHGLLGKKLSMYKQCVSVISTYTSLFMILNDYTSCVHTWVRKVGNLSGLNASELSIRPKAGELWSRLGIFTLRKDHKYFGDQLFLVLRWIGLLHILSFPVKMYPTCMSCFCLPCLYSLSDANLHWLGYNPKRVVQYECDPDQNTSH